MIIPINIIFIIIWALIVPYILGQLISIPDGRSGGGMTVTKSIVYGFMLMCTFFQLLAVPMILLHVPFHILKYTWIAAMVLMCILSLRLYIRRKKDGTSESGTLAGIKSFVSGLCKDRFAIIVWIAALLLIAFETCLLVFRMHTDTDDARFIVDAMEALKKDTMLEYNPITGIHHGIPVGEQLKDVTAPYPIFIALASSLFGLHPAITAHTIMPLLFIPLSYAVFLLVGDHIFRGDVRDKGLFMLFLALIHLFSFETIYSAGYTLLTIIWQGRSIVAMIMLPLLWYILMVCSDRDRLAARDYILIAAASLACAMLSNMGSLFAFILCMAYGLSFTISRKSLKPVFFMGISMIPDISFVLLSRLLYSGILYRN